MPHLPQRRVTKADYQLLTNYHTQGYSTAMMAKELGVAPHQVRRALFQLGLKCAAPQSTQPISWEQYQLIKWYENNTFSSQYLAERLGGVSLITLQAQLRGSKPMSFRRIGVFVRLIAELDPQAILLSKPPLLTFGAFRLLSPVVQFYWVLHQSTYLARRLKDDGGVNLYHCKDEGRGFFVEVGIDDGQGQAVVLRSFVSSGPLEDYIHGVQLPEA